MAVFDTCCCCSLRAGAIMIGAVQLMLSLSLLVFGINLLLVDNLGEYLQDIWKQLYHNNDHNEPVIEGLKNNTTGFSFLDLPTRQILAIEFTILMSLVCLGASVITNVLLIIGATKRLLYFLIPWLALQWIGLFAVMGVLGLMLWQLILLESAGRYWGLLMFGIGVLILLLVALLFVLSLYQNLRDEELPELRPDIELMNRHLWMPKQHTF